MEESRVRMGFIDEYSSLSWIGWPGSLYKNLAH